MSTTEPLSGIGGQFELLVQSITDYAIFMLDPMGRVISWNSGASRSMGYEADEVIGCHFSCFYTAEERGRGSPEAALKTAEGIGRFETDNWRVRKNGSQFWANVIIEPMRDQAGHLIGFAKITRDLTERRAAELKLHASEQRFRMLVQSVTDYAIYMLDLDGRVISWNAGAERFKGYSASEIIGEHFSRFYTDEDRTAGLPRAALETSQREGRFEAEGWRVRKDGSRFWAGVIVDPVLDDAGDLVGYAKITRDLTEKREIEGRLRQSLKMEAVGQLTGGLAHDFNNLLAGMSGSLQLIRTRIAQGRAAEVDRYLAAAESAVDRAAALTHRLLAFSRRQTLAPELADVNQLVEGLEDLIRGTIGPNNELRIEKDPDLWLTLIDLNQLENALLNLCINARDAMAEGGVLTIQTANRSLGPVAASNHDLPPGDYVAVSVEDTGKGMSDEILARAFDPFFTTKPLGEGTGLGLSMVFGFARQSAGQVTIDSKEGQGSTVRMYLPKHSSDPQVDLNTPAPAAAAKMGHELVLVIDDEAAISMLVTEALEEAGYSTIEAHDGPTGLRALEANPSISLLITDVGLPGGLDGGQVAEAARSSRPDLKVIFITGYVADAAVGGAPLQPEMAVITKPFKIDELVAKVREMLHG